MATVSDLIGTCSGDQWNEKVEVKVSVMAQLIIVHVASILSARFEGPQGTLTASLRANFLENIHMTGSACIDGEVKMIVEHFGAKFEVLTFSLFSKMCL